MTVDWAPDPAIAHRLKGAVNTGDRTGYLRTLARTGLVLPISPAAAAGDEPIAWAVESHEGRTYAFAYTSTAAMGRPPRPYRVCAAVDVAYGLPDRRWWLAVDTGRPTQVFLGPDGLAGLRGAEEPVEAALRAAVASGTREAYLLALLGAEIVVPMLPDGSPSRDLTDPEFAWWPAEETGGRPAATVFTSEARLRATVGDVPWLAVDFADLVAVWPPDRDAAINPGSPIGGHLPVETLRNLAGWLESTQESAESAAEYAASRPALSEEAREKAAQAAARDAVKAALAGRAEQPILQVLVPSGYVRAYLDQGHDRVAGLVHRRPAVVETPAALLHRLGLLGSGSPFSPDESVYVLRWPGTAVGDQPAMEAVTLPHGAELWRLDPAGREERMGWYDANNGRWIT
jgi:hypothetical protein